MFLGLCNYNTVGCRRSAFWQCCSLVWNDRQVHRKEDINNDHVISASVPAARITVWKQHHILKAQPYTNKSFAVSCIIMKALSFFFGVSFLFILLCMWLICCLGAIVIVVALLLWADGYWVHGPRLGLGEVARQNQGNVCKMFLGKLHQLTTSCLLTAHTSSQRGIVCKHGEEKKACKDTN